MKTFTTIFILLFVLFAGTNTFAKDIYLSDTGVDTNDGLTNATGSV